MHCFKRKSPCFVSSFAGKPIPTREISRNATCPASCRLRPSTHCRQITMTATQNQSEAASKRPKVAIIATSIAKENVNQQIESSPDRGIFGMKAKAYWESMGFLPLFFAGFGIVALAIKMVKVKQGQWQSGTTGVNKAVTPVSVITSPEEEKELHVFKCGGCGYEMYPARGREFKFFPDSFKCPLCETPKSEFWDLNDPTDPRNQEPEEVDAAEQSTVESNGSDIAGIDVQAEAPVTDSTEGKEPSASAE